MAAILDFQNGRRKMFSLKLLWMSLRYRYGQNIIINPYYHSVTNNTSEEHQNVNLESSWLKGRGLILFKVEFFSQKS